MAASPALARGIQSRSDIWVRVGFASSGILLLVGCLYAIRFCSSGPDISGHAIGTDDAFISYLYARNWVQGHGLVFNPGEYVEGYSNLLYVLLMGIPFRLGIDVFNFSVGLNTLFALAAWAVLIGFLRARLGDRAAMWGGLLFALSPSIWIWVSAGLETPMILLLQMGLWICVEEIDAGRPSSRTLTLLCLCVGLLVLSRADGFVSGVLAAAYLLTKGKRRAGLAAGVTVAAVFGGLLAWRLSYYHDVLPNTYYAKVTGQLLLRLRSAIKELGGIVARQGVGPYLLAMIFAAGLLVRRAFADPLGALRELRFGVAFSLSWLAYWLYVGGDNFEDRFLIILIPIGIHLLLKGILRDQTGMTGRYLLALVLILQLLPVVRLDYFGKSFGAKYDHRIKLGEFVKARWPGRVLATTAAGKIPFYSELRTIDMLGLCDRHISRQPVAKFVPGHSKFDIDYVLSRKPDLIIAAFEGEGLDLQQLTADQYRRAGYRLRYVVNTEPRSRGDRDLIDVRDRRDEEILLLRRLDWRTALLERQPTAP